MTPTRVLSAICVIAFATVAGCTRHTDANATGMHLPPIDHERVSLDDAVTWPVQRGLAADLDNDGIDERLVVASDVTAGADDEPLWEDGHRWAVWVVEPETEAAGDSVRTLLYGRFIPLGRADVSVMVPSVGEAPHVLVLERGPSQVAAEEVRYVGPGDARSITGAYFQIARGVTFP